MKHEYVHKDCESEILTLVKLLHSPHPQIVRTIKCNLDTLLEHDQTLSAQLMEPAIKQD